MRIVKVLGVLCVIGGIGLIGVSNYISDQVASGQEKIAQGEDMVQKGQGITSLNPYSKQLSKPLWDSAQEKIDAGKEQVSYYGGLAQNLKIGGFVAIAIGLLLFFLGFKKKK